jgi:metal-responsive CopG/Arc/MetJ family transcriptional regulator
MEIEMTTQMVRLSATVPKHIVDEADEIAIASKVSRSQLISECLTEMIQKRKKTLLAEGYRAMAKQHEEFALLTQDAAKEVLPNW